jgi:hypothetical protein
MKASIAAAFLALLLIPTLAGAMPLFLSDLNLLLGDICGIRDDADPTTRRPPDVGKPNGGPVDFGPAKTITDDIDPMINRPPGKGNPDGGPVDFGQVKIGDSADPIILIKPKGGKN